MEIISTNQLEAILEDGNVIIVDARGGADAYDRYKSGHLAGALFVDLETDLSNKSANAAHGGRHPLPEPGEFGKFLSKINITPSSTVVVYDDKRGANAAARFWWMLKAAGVTNVYVVSGGLESIIDEGFEITIDEPSISSGSSEFVLDEWKLPVVDIKRVSEVAEHEDYLVIDVRENYRYRGDSEPIDLIAGHIPGAINIPYTSNLDEKGEFLPVNELLEKYRKAVAGRNPSHIIVHCGSGVTACHTLLAIDYAGMEIPKLYVGSWSEWSRNNKLIATQD